MQSDKKWTKPQLQSIDRRLLENWDRDKLKHVRELVHGALESLEASGQAPKAAAKVRAVLADIDAALAEIPSSGP